MLVVKPGIKVYLENYDMDGQLLLARIRKKKGCGNDDKYNPNIIIICKSCNKNSGCKITS
jgi:hypothetical protein